MRRDWLPSSQTRPHPGRLQELTQLIHKRHDARQAMLSDGFAAWDYYVAMLLIVTGTV